jgi:hypothetical protein
MIPAANYYSFNSFCFSIKLNDWFSMMFNYTSSEARFSLVIYENIVEKNQ